MKPRHITTSWSLTYFWAILSILLATLSTFSFVQVEWIVKRETQVITHYHFPTVNTTAINLSHETDTLYNRWASNRYQISGREQHNYEVVKRVQKTVTVFSFGALGSCVHYQGLSNHCRSHDHGQGIWCVITLSGGLGCLTLCLSAVMSVMAISLPSSKLRYEAARAVGQAQMVSVVLLFITFLGFPLRLGSDLVKSHCGRDSGPYNLGTAGCEVGWAYALLIVSSSLALYCPILVHFTFVVKPPCLPKYL